MGQALYRKYRSRSLDEIVGQEHITTTLRQALKSGRISHAYLFTGPRGTGKTSIARILAHELNGLAYADDSSHIDIIEIDAASNRRIDEIRELREKVYVAPVSAKYKVYIIDEVHMLTREAFNALLKTLEEPPAHVIFILATTDVHKLPETIISRTQRFTFKPGEPVKVAAHLKKIAEQEGLGVSDEALALIAKHGEGSFRDSVSLLDQASSQDGELTADGVLAMLGIPPEAALDELVRSLAGYGDASNLMNQLLSLFAQGYQAATIAKQLSERLRAQLLSGQPELPQLQILSLLRELIDVPASRDPERLLEIVLLQVIDGPSEAVSQTVAQKPAANPVKPPASQKTTAEMPKNDSAPLSKPADKQIIAPAKTEENMPPPMPKPKVTTMASDSADLLPLEEASWPAILSALKKRHNTVYSVARMAQPDFSEPGILRLKFNFPFHQKRLAEAKNRQLVADTVQTLTGQAIGVECLVDKAASPAPPTTATPEVPPQPPADLIAISNIFGGGELLES